MFILYNTDHEAYDPHDTLLARLAADLIKDIKSTKIPMRTDNQGGRCIHLPEYFNQMIYATLSK